MYNLFVKRETSLVNAAIFLLFLLLSSVCVLCCPFFNLDYILMAIVFFFLVFIFWVNPNFLLRNVLLFFVMISHILGVFVIENSSFYLFELEVYSSRASSLPLLVLSYFILVTVVYFLDAKIPFQKNKTLIEQNDETIICFSKERYIRLNNLKLLIWICFIFCIILFIKVSPHPYFSMNNVDRFLYRTYYLTPLFAKLERIVSYCLPFIILLVVRKKNKCALLTVLIYSLYLFWIGEKFGGYWSMVVFGCIVYSIEGEKASIFELRRFLFKVFVVICSLMMILFFHRYLTNSSNFKDYLFQRVAQQGQLYWKIYQDENEKCTEVNQLESEVATFYRLDDRIEKRYDHGIYKIMKLTTPLPRFWRKIDFHSRYTASTYASVYYYFKEIGVIVFSVCIGFLYWFFLRLFLVSIDELYFIDAFICNKLFSVVILVLGMSEFNALFSFKFLFFLLLLFGIKMMRYYYDDILKSKK